MPDYALNEMPKNFKDGVTRVNIYLLHVYVLEVDEKKNQITIDIGDEGGLDILKLTPIQPVDDISPSKP